MEIAKQKIISVCSAGAARKAKPENTGTEQRDYFLLNWRTWMILNHIINLMAAHQPDNILYAGGLEHIVMSQALL